MTAFYQTIQFTFEEEELDDCKCPSDYEFKFPAVSSTSSFPQTAAIVQFYDSSMTTSNFICSTNKTNSKNNKFACNTANGEKYSDSNKNSNNRNNNGGSSHGSNGGDRSSSYRSVIAEQVTSEEEDKLFIQETINILDGKKTELMEEIDKLKRYYNPEHTFSLYRVSFNSSDIPLYHEKLKIGKSPCGFTRKREKGKLR